MTTINLDTQWQIYYPKVYGYFFRRVNNRLDVEDLTSLVLTYFFEALSNPEKASKIKSPNAYLWKIAYNQLMVFITNKSKEPVPVGLDDNLEVIDDSQDNTRSTNYTERSKKLLDCINISLSGLDLIIVTKSLIEDWTSPKVATELNLTAVNVRKRLSRAVTKLRQKCRVVWEN